MALLILLVLLALIVLWIIAAYNGLIALKNQVANAWKQIDVQLKRRHDLIPNLVNTVKGAMDFERSTLEAVISARNKAVSASGVAQTAKAEGELTQALGRLFALTEAYPDLKATGNVAQLQEELTSTENKIGFARQLYNDTATQYNTKQATFPTMLVAAWRRPRRRSSGRSRTTRSARCRRSICRPPNRRRERGRQPLRATGSQPPPLHLARHRLHRLLRLGRVRRRCGLRPPDRRRPGGRLPPRRPRHRVVHHAGGRRHLLVLVALRAAPGAVVHRRPRAGRARHAGGAAAGERGGGDGDRLGSPAAPRLDRARRRPERVRDRARRRDREPRGDGGPPPHPLTR